MPFKPIETYGINKDALISMSGDFEDYAIDSYNQEYGTNWTQENKPDYLSDFILLFISITLFGWKGAKVTNYDSQAVNIAKQVFGGDYQDYKGIDETTKQIVEKIKSVPQKVGVLDNTAKQSETTTSKNTPNSTQITTETNQNESSKNTPNQDQKPSITEQPSNEQSDQTPSKSDLSKAIDSRVNVIIEGLALIILQVTISELAKEDKREVIGAKSVRDRNVRQTHQRNDGHFFERGSQFPMYDYNCRCLYKYFKNAKEAEEGGFVKL